MVAPRVSPSPLPLSPKSEGEGVRQHGRMRPRHTQEAIQDKDMGEGARATHKRNLRIDQ